MDKGKKRHAKNGCVLLASPSVRRLCPVPTKYAIDFNHVTVRWRARFIEILHLTGESNRQMLGVRRSRQISNKAWNRRGLFRLKVVCTTSLNDYILCSFATKGSTIIKKMSRIPSVLIQTYIKLINTDDFIVLCVP